MTNKQNTATQAPDDANSEKKNIISSQDKIKKVPHEYKCFVMMSFGENRDEKIKVQKQLFEKFEEAAKKLKDINIYVNLDRADQKLKDFELIENVHKYILESDFCLADITGMNPNVMYEVGFARALDKELIFITQAKKSYPIDVSNYVITTYTNNDTGLEILVQKLAGYFKEAIKIVELKRKSTKDSYEVTCFESGEVSDLGDAMRWKIIRNLNFVFWHLIQIVFLLKPVLVNLALR